MLSSETLAILCLLPTLAGCYATRQALHQNDLFNTRRPVSEVVEDKATSDKTREALLQVEAVLRFATAEGLSTKGAYRYVIIKEQPVVSYLVQAAYADRLESVTWWFPVIGAVPYRGYFEKSERDAEAATLAAKGYDLYLSGAGAFSSLGWFDDPIFSAMLLRSDADLAHLFLHELTHRTFWAPGSTLFNENLAEYVATVLTVKFLAARDDKVAIARYADRRGDRALFKAWLVDLRAALEKLYENPEHLPREEILTRKVALFKAYQAPPRKPAFKSVDFVQGEDWNNAAVLAASLYAPDIDQFAKAHACLKDPRVINFLNVLRRLTDETGDPFVALARMCAKDVHVD